MIFNISSGGGSATNGNVAKVTATADDTLQGKKGVDNLGNLFEGTIPKRGTVNSVLFESNTYVELEKGYYEGGKISISTETKTVSATTQDQIVKPTDGKVLTEVLVKAGGERCSYGSLRMGYEITGRTVTISGLEGFSVINHIFINAFDDKPSNNQIIVAASLLEFNLIEGSPQKIYALVGDDSAYGETELSVVEIDCSFNGSTLILTAPTADNFVGGTYFIVGRS